MRVAHFGTFDVANYGDTLFPIVAQRRLAGLALVHVSPVGRASPYSDALRTIRCTEAETQQFDGVIIGGGNIVHNSRTTLSDYRTVARTAYPALWLGATALAQRQGCPLVVNAPTVSKLGMADRRLLATTVRAANYTAVRDASSWELLGRDASNLLLEQPVGPLERTSESSSALGVPSTTPSSMSAWAAHRFSVDAAEIPKSAALCSYDAPRLSAAA